MPREKTGELVEERQREDVGTVRSGQIAVSAWQQPLTDLNSGNATPCIMLASGKLPSVHKPGEASLRPLGSVDFWRQHNSRPKSAFRDARTAPEKEPSPPTDADTAGAKQQYRAERTPGQPSHFRRFFALRTDGSPSGSTVCSGSASASPADAVLTTAGNPGARASASTQTLTEADLRTEHARQKRERARSCCHGQGRGLSPGAHVEI